MTEAQTIEAVAEELAGELREEGRITDAVERDLLARARALRNDIEREY